jgi:hypothetical protein
LHNGTSRCLNGVTIAGIDAAFVNQSSADAHERCAGGKVCGEISRLDPAGRAECDVGKYADQRFDMSWPAD